MSPLERGESRTPDRLWRPSRKSKKRITHKHERKIIQAVQERQTRCSNQGPQADQRCPRTEATDAFSRYENAFSRYNSTSWRTLSAPLRSIATQRTVVQSAASGRVFGALVNGSRYSLTRLGEPRIGRRDEKGHRQVKSIP